MSEKTDSGTVGDEILEGADGDGAGEKAVGVGASGDASGLDSSLGFGAEPAMDSSEDAAGVDAADAAASMEAAVDASTMPAVGAAEAAAVVGAAGDAVGLGTPVDAASEPAVGTAGDAAAMDPAGDAPVLDPAVGAAVLDASGDADGGDGVVSDPSSAEGHLRQTSNEPILSADEELVDIDMDEDLKKVLFYAIDEACGKIADGEELVPFTMVLAGDDIFCDSHPDEDVAACFESAATAVNTIAHIAQGYVFCYDGYMETDQGQSDMLIAEVGKKHEDGAAAFGLAYEISEDGSSVTFDEALVSLGDVENLFDPKLVEEAEMIQAAYAAEAEEQEEGDAEDGAEED